MGNFRGRRSSVSRTTTSSSVSSTAWTSLSSSPGPSVLKLHKSLEAPRATLRSMKWTYNGLPFLPWLRNGVQQKRNSWQDGVYGTNCPIPPGRNFTYVLQVKDQIGSYFYFPSLALHKAAGGYGGFKIASRSVIPVPFDPPAGDFTILAGDWFVKNHTVSIVPQIYGRFARIQKRSDFRYCLRR